MTIKSIAVAATLAALACASLAWAAPDAPTPPPAPTAPPAPTPPPAPGQAPIVTVTGQRPLPQHKCGPRDDACIKAVVANIWAQHPQEVRQWCLKEDMRLTEKRFMFEQFAAPGDSPVDTSVPDAERQLCDYGRKHHIK